MFSDKKAHLFDSMIFSQEQPAWVLHEDDKHSNQNNILEYNAISSEK